MKEELNKSQKDALESILHSSYELDEKLILAIHLIPNRNRKFWEEAFEKPERALDPIFEELRNSLHIEFKGPRRTGGYVVSEERKRVLDFNWLASIVKNKHEKSNGSRYWEKLCGVILEYSSLICSDASALQDMEALCEHPIDSTRIEMIDHFINKYIDVKDDVENLPNEIKYEILKKELFDFVEQLKNTGKNYDIILDVYSLHSVLWCDIDLFEQFVAACKDAYNGIPGPIIKLQQKLTTSRLITEVIPYTAKMISDVEYINEMRQPEGLVKLQMFEKFLDRILADKDSDIQSHSRDFHEENLTTMKECGWMKSESFLRAYQKHMRWALPKPVIDGHPFLSKVLYSWNISSETAND